MTLLETLLRMVVFFEKCNHLFQNVIATGTYRCNNVQVRLERVSLINGLFFRGSNVEVQITFFFNNHAFFGIVYYGYDIYFGR